MSTAVPPRRMPAAPGRPPARDRRPAAQAGIDPFRVLRRHMLLIIASVFVGGAVGAGAYFALVRTYPLYEAAVVFKVQPGVAEAGEIATAARMREDDVALIAYTEIQTILSDPVLRDAIQTRDVTNTSWWQGSHGRTTNYDEAVRELQNELDAGILSGTQLFQVRWVDGDRESVAVLLNAIADEYIDFRNERLENEYRANRERFETELNDTTNDIERVRGDIESFIEEYGITTGSDPRYSQIAQSVDGKTELLTQVESELSSATSALAQVNAKLARRLGYSEDDILRADQDPSVAAQIQQVQALKVELGAARSRYADPTHPEIRRIEERIAAAEATENARREQVIRRDLGANQRQLADLVESRREQVESLRSQIQNEQRELSLLRARLSELETMQVRKASLEEARSRLQDVLREVDLISVREDAKQTQLWQRARTPDMRYFPQIVVLVPLGVLLVTGLTVGVIFLRELTDQRVRSASDLKVIPGADLLGVIPDRTEDPTKCKRAELAVTEAPASVLAESYRMTVTPLVKAMDAHGLQSCVFTSGLPSAGVTTVVTNVAASLAASGRRVVVVDANFRRPRVAEILGGDSAAAGLGDVLMGQAELDAVIRTAPNDVHWVSAGEPSTRVVERLDTERLSRVVADLRDRFDLVLFDAPPSVVAVEALSLANRLDAVVLVVRANDEQKGLVARLIGMFEGAHAELLGIILNRPRVTAGGYFRENFRRIASYDSERAKDEARRSAATAAAAASDDRTAGD